MTEPTDDTSILEAFYAGVQFAYNHPGEQSSPPYAEPFLTAYHLGIESGQSAASGSGLPGPGAGALDPPYDGPAVEPYREGGVPWDEYQKQIQELLEPLFHAHMPHVEVEPFEVPPPPPPWTR